MEAKLDGMRRDLQKRLAQARGMAVCFALLLVAAVSGVIPTGVAGPSARDFISGFQVGLLLALCVFALYRKVRCQRALRDDAAVRRLYYQEHDERTRYIAQQVGRSSMAVNTVLLVVAAVIAGYFSVTVFVTLLAVAAVQGLVQLLLKGLCARRYTGEEE